MASRHYGSHLTDSDGQPFQNVAIGLDFGTSNTSMAISNNAKVNILRNDRREIVTPSVVAFDEERILIGNEATASSIKPENIIWGMKRFLGRSCNDLKKNYENQSFSISYNRTNPRILVQDKQLHVQQIVAILFSKLMAPIEGRYRVLPRVVLTVPSSFGHSQRKALTDAAKIAEIDVLQLIEETTAAAIAFACKKTLEQSRNILIFHLGGGCFDVAIFRIAGHSIELLSSVASSDIGGINFTQHIVDYVFEKTGSSNDKSCFKTLKQVIAACEEAKQKLSDIKDTKIKIDMNEPFSRRQFETRSKQLREIINWAIKFALSIARLSSEEIDNYFMIGKSTMMPCIKGTLKKHFNKSKKKDIMNADDAAVCGAAILAESITKQSETNFHVSNNVNKRKITIADGKVSSYCCQEDTFHDSVASALLEGLIDDVKQLVESDHNLNVEFTIQERHLQEGCRETRHYRKDTERSDCKSVLKSQRLFEMAMEVKAYLKADRNWLEIDKRKTTLFKDIHKTEYVIKELLRQAAHRSSFKNDVRVLQKKFQGFSDRISQMESLSVDELEKGEELGAKLRKDVDELKSKIDNTVTATTSTSFGSRTNSSSHAIGIDLGTANSCVATVVDGRVEVIENDCRNLVTPSCVTFTGGRTLIGRPERDPANTYNIKRTMRRMFDDPKKKEEKKIKGSATRRKVGAKSCEKTYSFEEISRLVLKYMRQIACDKLDEDVCDAVVTVPACSNHMQRSAKKTAAELAGCNLLGIINEPTAAAIAFGWENECSQNRNILVYDFGGGNFDVTVLSIKGSKFDVKASSGNAYLGGDDLTRRLMDYFLKRLRTKQKRDLRKDRCAMSKLWMECEKAKIKLSTEHAYKLLGNNIRADIKLTKSIKRTKFVSLSSDLMDKTIDYVEDALKESGMKKGEIDFVIPIGGSSKIPYVIKKLEKYFGKDVIKEIRSSDQMIAKGAAIYASFLERQKTTVDLSEVTPLSFGIKLPNGMTSILIRRNTKIPVARSKTYSKSNNGQEYSTIQICQGEKKRFKHNEYLGDISVKIPPKQRAKVKILIEFNLNANGILNAKAGVEGGESKSIVINLWNTSDKLDTGNRREKPILEREHYKGLQETAF